MNNNCVKNQYYPNYNLDKIIKDGQTARQMKNHNFYNPTHSTVLLEYTYD